MKGTKVMVDVQERLAQDREVEQGARTWSRRGYLGLALAIQDALMIYSALLCAYWVRFHVGLGPSIQSPVALSEYQKVALPLVGIMLALLFVKGAYRRRLSLELVHELITVTSASTIGVSVIVVLSFMLRQFEYSRGVIVYLWLLLIGLLGVTRVLFRCGQIVCYKRGWGIRRLLVVGASDVGKMIMQSVTNRPDLGYRVIGFVDRRSEQREGDFGRFQRVGYIADLPDLLETERIDEVLLALPGSAHEEAWSIIRWCGEAGVELKLVPDMFQVNLSQVEVDDIAGIPLLDVRAIPKRRLERTAKRCLDLVLGSIVAVLSLPLLAVLALLIVLDSRGPVFVRQERVGKKGTRFTCVKLRTMREDAEYLIETMAAMNEAQGPIFKIRNDPRLTRIGRYIRRLSLDEIPQIWSVVRGDMSLVGPRPPLPREVVKYEPWHLRRLEVTPGMTGLWQVSGRSNLSFDEMVMMDAMYVDNWSLALDLKILLKTILVVLTTRGAF